MMSACEGCIFTSLLLRVTDGRKSFSILSIARTISSNTFLCRCSFTTLTCYTNTRILLIRTNSRTVHVSTKTSQFRFFLFDNIASYPNTEDSTDRLVVTSLQLHVTPVFELLDIVAPPQNSVTPSRDTALPTAGNSHSFRGRVKGQTSYTHTVLLTMY